MKKDRATCPHCGKDITESVNRFLAGRAARASLLKRSKEYYVDLAKKRWAKKKTTDGKKDTGPVGKDDTPPSTPQSDALRRT